MLGWDARVARSSNSSRRRVLAQLLERLAESPGPANVGDAIVKVGGI
jgi:hypothetical protein